MAWRIYLVPLIVNGKGDRIPAYVDTDLADVPTSLLDYGNEPVGLLSGDVTPAQHAALAAHADVTALPADLDQSLGGQLGAVQSALASLNIPEDWVQAAFTYRQVLRVMATMFLFTQRVSAFHPARVFGGTVTLATRVNQLPAGVRTALQSAATSLGIDTGQLPGTMTLRQLFKVCGDSAHLLEIFLGPETL